MKLKRLAVLGIGIGLLLVGYRVYTVAQYHVVAATVTDVRESKTECTRISGKEEECTHFDVQVSYPTSIGEKSGMVGGDARRAKVKTGDIINVFVRDDEPSDLHIDLYRKGWKGPLSLLSLSVLAFTVLRFKKKDALSEQHEHS